jgi:hypothetical protein
MSDVSAPSFEEPDEEEEADPKPKKAKRSAQPKLSYGDPDNMGPRRWHSFCHEVTLEGIVHGSHQLHVCVRDTSISPYMHGGKHWCVCGFEWGHGDSIEEMAEESKEERRVEAVA